MSGIYVICQTPFKQAPSSIDSIGPDNYTMIEGGQVLDLYGIEIEEAPNEHYKIQVVQPINGKITHYVAKADTIIDKRWASILKNNSK